MKRRLWIWTLPLALLPACSSDSNPTSDEPDPPTGVEWSADAVTLAARVSFDSFKENISVLSDFGDRTQGSESNLAAGGWIEAQLASYGYEVEHHDYTFQGDPRQSIYATKVGAERPEDMYIVSAHMDGRGEGGAADDDASGVALVLEAARVLGEENVETDTSVRFIFWNNEETGLNGSSAYVADRLALQGVESPAGSGLFPEPRWLGVIQHDMILFDHGLPPAASQISNADIDVEFQAGALLASEGADLADLLAAGNERFSEEYPAEVGSNMRNTDSWPFRNHTAAVSVRENQRVAEIGAGANPHWHQPTDVFETYSDDDFRLGADAVRMTVGTVAHLAGGRVGS